MKKLIVTFAVCSGLAFAGPGKAAYEVVLGVTYPVRHVKKTMHAGEKAAKGTAKVAGKVIKTIVW